MDVTTGRGTIPDSSENSGTSVAGSDAGNNADAWDSVRADSDIQFEPLPPREIEPPPAWLQAIGEFFEAVFAPLARFLAGSWPVLKWVLLALLVAMIAAIVWRLVEPYFGRPKAEPVEEYWQPEREQARALLEDADQLAAAGDYDAAVRLLLARSVGQIAEAQPGLVEPSSTARELANQPSLPDKARTAFGVIASGVERSLFALQDLGQQDWQAARTAYADFALEKL
ncbi:hypothetical protein [Parerythrobacter jejuensis]|uniref:hypothetical protein n=1 Tax=Parerythrobacter jejuensis TaxID=795812 RepID=UPI0018F8C635|nr:hypothetical protein [Parerythrobacter jejuensis]